MKFNRPFRLLTKLIPYPDLIGPYFFMEWKNRLLFILLAGIVFLGLVAYVPSMILSVIEQVWIVAVIDTLVYAAAIYTAFSRRMSSDNKVKVILITFYVLGIALLIFLGQKGAGFNWLFLFPLLSSFFYGYRGIVVSTIINVVSLSLLFIPIYYEMEGFGLINQYDKGGWIVNSVNFVAISSLISLALAVVLVNIDKSIKKEKRMTELLEKNRDQLKIEKNRAEESEKLKSAFLANMSHEIRTPLNAIIGFSALLKKNKLPREEFTHFTSIIDMAGKQLLTIIDDIIDISKIESRQMVVHPAPVEIFPCLQHVTEVQRNRIKMLKKDIRIDLQVSEKLKKLVLLTDEIRFKQIADNLIGNAVKYTDAGTITTGYTMKQKEGKAVAEFYVKDTGRGIPAEDHELIFNRFSKAGNVKFHEGTGLGLSITKGLLDLLGGEIRLKSKPGTGSEFYFTLPADDVDMREFEETDEDDAGEQTSVTGFEGKQIYIAEDDDFSYLLFVEMLRPLNVKIQQAENGRVLLEMVEKKTPDLILLDLRMPEMSGLEALKEIRKTHRDLPVIAQSAHVLPEERRKCFEQGCNDYISKPVDPEKLYALFNKYLN